jgi:hypothetical protein
MRKKEESNPSARARKNTSKSLSLVTRALCGIWRGFDLFVFIASTTQLDRWWRLSVRWRTRQSGAHRTCPVPPPRHQCRWILPVGASDFRARLDVRCTPDMYCALSGAPVWARLTSARAERALNVPQVAVGAEIAVAPWLHRTVRCTPDMSGEL